MARKSEGSRRAGQRPGVVTSAKRGGPGKGFWMAVGVIAVIFGTDTAAKYDKALRKIGIDLGQLSSQAGHA